MDATCLTTSGFWESDTCHVMVNDRDKAAIAQSEILRPWCEGNDELRGCVLFSTSGSTSDGKWVALSRRALLASAQAVNEHLEVTGNDHWLLALPTFHVGGMGIIARANLASCGLSHYQDAWDAQKFHQTLENKVTLTSLVPTQLTDLVAAGLNAPDSLRAVLIGGGALDDDTYQKAIELGWPVIETYGMTEASSQIATASVTDRKLKLLPCWQARTDDSGILSIKGDPMLTSRLAVCHGQVISEPVLRDGWFATSDRVELVEGCLVFKGRSDRCIKILGELVDLADIEKQWQSLSAGVSFVVVAMPDQRKGSRLLICTENCADAGVFQKKLDEYNQACNPVARIDCVRDVDVFPRSDLGKIRYQKLIEILQGDKLK